MAAVTTCENHLYLNKDQRETSKKIVLSYIFTYYKVVEHCNCLCYFIVIYCIILVIFTIVMRI